MEKFVRKIRRIGTHSYAVIIPKELIQRFRWKERQKISLILRGKKKELLIRDWKK